MENITSIEIEKKIEYLKSLGIIIYDEYAGIIDYQIDYQSYELNLDKIEIGESIYDIIKSSLMISCCNAYLDRDAMICPICYEHC